MVAPETPLSAVNRFQYPSLNQPRQIRLLKLSYKDGSRLDMHCSFLPVSLDDLQAEYKAVSYFWGDPTPAHLLECAANEHIPITDTVLSILYYMIESKETEYFWIDALCIDQSNIVEREQQVRLMGEIFAAAKSVIAWIGEPSDDSDEAIQFVSILYSAMDELKTYGEPIAEENLTGLPLCEHPSSRWTALANLANRPWFQRVWVIQEIVVASYATITCGGASVEWNKLAEVVDTIFRHGLIILTTYSVEGRLMFPPGLGSISEINQMRTKFKAGIPISLQDALLDTVLYNATDVRDKVFALLGLPSDAHDSEFDPDYTALPETIYTRVSRQLLGRENDPLDTLYAAGIGYHCALHNLPSWVPDWSYKGYDSHTILGRGGAAIGYNASGNYNMIPRVRANPTANSISLFGRVIDAISTLAADTPTQKTTLDPELQKQNAAADLAWFNSIANILPKNETYITNEPFYPDVVCRALIANLDPAGFPAPPSCTTHFLTFMKKLRLASEGKELSSREEKASANHFQIALSIAVSGRRVFFTRKKHLAAGPPRVRVGDEVCLFYGASTPFIIRKRAHDGYFMVGQCYVHGLMSGEGMAMGEEKEITLY